ncbi:hypothetical protein NPIL_106871, partial [Nephila pilipes]
FNPNPNTEYQEHYSVYPFLKEMLCFLRSGKIQYQNLLQSLHANFLIISAGVMALVSSVGCIPLNSKAAGWMSSAGEDSRSYSHLGGGSK